jgi:epoxyqueuosine reductase
LASAAERLCTDESPLVRAMAAWALRQLLEPRAFARLAGHHAAREQDSAVADEWAAA